MVNCLVVKVVVMICNLVLLGNFTDPITGQTIIPPGGQLFDNDANRLYISVTTEPDQNIL